MQSYDFEIQTRKCDLNTEADALSRIEVDAIDVDEAEDPWYEDMFQKVLDEPGAHSRFKIADEKLFYFTGLVRGKPHYVPVIKYADRQKFMEDNHCPPTSGHFGIAKTFTKLKRLGYWPHQFSDVKKFVSKCTVCRAAKSSRQVPTGEMHSHQAVDVWQTFCCDLAGPYPRSSAGNRYVMVVTDLFSKYSFLIPVGKATAIQITKKFEK